MYYFCGNQIKQTPSNFMGKNLVFVQKLFYFVVIIVFSYIILKEAKQFLYPVAIALLLSYLLYPVISILEYKLKFPRTLAILITLITAIVISYFILNILYHQIKFFIKDFPVFKEQALINLKRIQLSITSKINISNESQNIWIREKFSNILDFSDKILEEILKRATGTIEALLLIPIFTFFMLFYRDRGKEFVLKIAEEKNSKLTNELLEQISKVTVKYMAGVITVVIILAFCHSVFLGIIGLKYAIFIGIFAASLSFIPYFGTLVSGLIPITFSILMSSNPYEPVIILIYFIIITFIDHNILTPSITGANVNLNPLVTILGLILAAEIWGVPGMIIIVPTLGIFKIICDNVEGLQPYGYILGTKHRSIDLIFFLKKFRKKENKNT